MKKSLIALAIAGAFVAPVAMADVTIYGVADASFDMTNNGDGTVVANTGATVAGTSASKVSSNASRLGFKGSEDLGGGTSAVWQIESGINIDGNNQTAGANPAGTTIGQRNTFAGLTGESWGTALLGHHDTPYKISTRGFDLFADSLADNRNLMGVATVNFNGRQSNVVAYISPAMSGVTLAAAYVAGAEGAIASASTKGSAWSLAALYGAGPLAVNAGYEVHTIGNAPGNVGAGVAAGTTQKESAWKVGAGYTMDQFSANVVYEKTQDDFGNSALGCGATAGADCGGHSAYAINGKFNVTASDTVKAAYTKAGDINGGAVAANKLNTAANMIALGYDHAMSKRTTVYALYTKLSNNNGAKYGLNGGGAASTGAVSASNFGADPSVWSLGMKHTF